MGGQSLGLPARSLNALATCSGSPRQSRVEPLGKHCLRRFLRGLPVFAGLAAFRHRAKLHAWTITRQMSCNYNGLSTAFGTGWGLWGLFRKG